ncbi:MAG: hypothetical protein ACYDBJ_10685 [Aggregatilineales bacterium]
MSKPLFTERLSVGITPEMDRYLEDLATVRTRKGKPMNKSDLIREAIRTYMDTQEDLAGSRKQIAKSLDGKLQALMDAVQAMQEQNQALQAQVDGLRQGLRQWVQTTKPLLEWAAMQRKAQP